jgi:transcriptional regulator with XRE-family HTH domain
MRKANVLLKTRIFEAGITQDELARRISVSPATLSSLVQGKAELKQLRMVQRIARELGTTIDELWPLEEETSE